jgi:hypothetical protein
MESGVDAAQIGGVVILPRLRFGVSRPLHRRAESAVHFFRLGGSVLPHQYPAAAVVVAIVDGHDAFSLPSRGNTRALARFAGEA